VSSRTSRARWIYLRGLDEPDSVAEFTEQLVEALHDKFGWTEEYAAGQVRVCAEIIEQNSEQWAAIRRRDELERSTRQAAE
jgi:hypothetical protein